MAGVQWSKGVSPPSGSGVPAYSEQSAQTSSQPYNVKPIEYTEQAYGAAPSYYGLPSGSEIYAPNTKGTSPITIPIVDETGRQIGEQRLGVKAPSGYLIEGGQLWKQGEQPMQTTPEGQTFMGGVYASGGAFPTTTQPTQPRGLPYQLALAFPQGLKQAETEYKFTEAAKKRSITGSTSEYIMTRRIGADVYPESKITGSTSEYIMTRSNVQINPTHYAANANQFLIGLRSSIGGKHTEYEQAISEVNKIQPKNIFQSAQKTASLGVLNIGKKSTGNVNALLQIPQAPLEAVYAKPVTTLKTAGTAVALGTAFGFVEIPAVVSLGLGALYGKGVYERTISSPRPLTTLTEIGITEIAPFGIAASIPREKIAGINWEKIRPTYGTGEIINTGKEKIEVGQEKTLWQGLTYRWGETTNAFFGKGDYGKWKGWTGYNKVPTIKTGQIGIIASAKDYSLFSKDLGFGESKYIKVKVEPISERMEFTPTTEGINLAKTEVTNIPIGKHIISYEPETFFQAKVYLSNAEKFNVNPAKLLVEGETISPTKQIEGARLVIQAIKAVGKYTKEPNLETLNAATKVFNARTIKRFNLYAQKTGAIPYGSSVTRSYLSPEVQRSAADWEALWNTRFEGSLKIHTQNLLKIAKEEGYTARIPKEEPFEIEVKLNKEWVKGAETKGLGIGGGESTAPIRAWGYWQDVRMYTEPIAGTNYGNAGRVSSLRGEAYRKLSATFAIRQAGAFAVEHEGQLKSSVDVARILYQQTRIAENKGDLLGAATGKRALDYLGKEWGISKKLMQEPITPEIVKSSFRFAPSTLPTALNLFKSPTPSIKVTSPLSINVRPSYNIKSPSPYSPSMSISPSVKSPSPKVPSPSIIPSPSMSISLSISKSISVKSPSISTSLSPSQSPSPYHSPSPKINIPLVSAIGLPPIIGFFGEPSKKGKYKSKRKTSYTPDVIAVMLGIKGKPKMIKGAYTGLEIRGMVTKKPNTKPSKDVKRLMARNKKFTRGLLR